MANTNYGPIVKRRQTFYICDCPPRPRSRRDIDVIHWYMHHVKNCSPRPIVDLHLPEYEVAE